MGKNSDGDEINEYERKYKENIKEKYGFDFEEYSKKYLNKETILKNKRIKRIIIRVIFILLIIGVPIYFIHWKALNNQIEIKKELVNIYNIEPIEGEKGIDILGNGYAIYKINEIPGIEIHTMFNTIEHNQNIDLNDRVFKYYFNKWTDSYKYKFKIEERYIDCKFWTIKKKNWILEFKTYIEVNNYDEMKAATKAIIRFVHFLPNQQILPSCYIKYKGQLIIPKSSTVLQSDEEMEEIAVKEFEIIDKKNNTK